jgi:prepilin-type N-terminal cleavage/methylation domain-containing protein
MAPTSRKNAFTLIEMMVVVAIIGILVALIVGISKYVFEEAARKKTLVTQQLLMTAIEQFKDITGKYPPDSNDLSLSPNDYSIKLKSLYGQLLGKEEAFDELETHFGWTSGQRTRFENRIKKDLISTINQLPEDAADTEEETFKDGFGNAMYYFRTEGLGSRPVVISAGPDGEPKTGDTIVNDRSNAVNEDNIRSDEN